MHIVDAITIRGKEDEWGNVHPYTLEGVKAAAEYLHSFGFTDMEVLVPRIRLPKTIRGEKNPELETAIKGAVGDQATPEVRRPKWMDPDSIGLPLCPTSWLPDKCAVVLPAERTFVGELTHLSPRYVAAIVHNPSRGIAIARS